MEIGSLGNENHGNWVLVAQNHENGVFNNSKS
jgi:hypothetical protein